MRRNASVSPPASGCALLASARYCLRISAWSASRGTPRTLCGSVQKRRVPSQRSSSRRRAASIGCAECRATSIGCVCGCRRERRLQIERGRERRREGGPPAPRAISRARLEPGDTKDTAAWPRRCRGCRTEQLGRGCSHSRSLRGRSHVTRCRHRLSVRGTRSHRLIS